MLYLKFAILFLGGYSCLELNVHPYLRRLKNIRDCKPLKIANGRTRIRSRSIFAQFICNKGFILVGERYIKCVKGEWSSTAPICVKNVCKKVSVPRNGFLFETFRGAVLNFFCLPGYKLYGFNRVFCDGTSWSGHLPTCLASNSTPSLSCNFESEDLCGWTHDLNHDFDWTRKTFNDNNTANTIQTGPRYDHTLGLDGQGHYMHIEASSRQINDTSRLISPIYSLDPKKNTQPISNIIEDPKQQQQLPDADTQSSESETLPDRMIKPPEESTSTDDSVQLKGKSICISLFYHMFGDAGQQLMVYLSATSNEKWDLRPEKALFWAKGNYGEGWHRMVAKIRETMVEEPFQIIIEGVSGESFTSDIAVDDVSIIEDCDYKEETKDNEKLTTAVEATIQIESCLNRCNGETPSHNAVAFLIACNCDENCVLNNTCCPDFTAICILGNTEEFATDISTIELFEVTTDEVLKSAENETPTTNIPNKNYNNENDTDNPIDWIFRHRPTILTSIKSTTAKTTTLKIMPTKTTTIINKKAIVTLATVKTTTTPITLKTFSSISTKPIELTSPTIKKQTELDFALISERSDMLITKSSPTYNNKDLELIQDGPPFSPRELSKYARITVSNTSRKQSAGVSQYLIIVGVVGFALVGIVATTALVKRYALRKCRQFGRGTGAHGDSQSDVRFLTSDEILDFTLQRPSEDDHVHTI